MIFSDLALARRLERAEATASAQFAVARRRLYPDSGSEWIECDGAYAVFDGPDSPVTQAFGLGVFQELTAATLDTVEHFFFERGAHVDIELCPLAGLPAVGLLCERGYRPIEIASVVYQPVIEPAVAQPGSIKVHVVGPEESQLWATVSARGWAAERPDLFDFVRKSGEISAVRDRSLCLLAEFDGEPGAAGALCLNEGVALFSGSATVPELRRRGLQGALLRERMRYAFGAGCDLAMMVAEAGSTSQRNAERNGFRIAYTRTKWRRALVPKP